MPDESITFLLANEFVEVNTLYYGDDMYERAIADLEAKLKRQRETVKATEELLSGLKALKDKDQIPLIPENPTNATDAGRARQRS